jgi:hypothetical protein
VLIDKGLGFMASGDISLCCLVALHRRYVVIPCWRIDLGIHAFYFVALTRLSLHV